MKVIVISRSVMSDSLQPHGLQTARLLCPWNSPGKNTGVGSRFLLQETFPPQGLNLALLYCKQIPYHLSHQESPIFLLFHRVLNFCYIFNLTSIWFSECSFSENLFYFYSIFISQGRLMKDFSKFSPLPIAVSFKFLLSYSVSSEILPLNSGAVWLFALT